MRPCNTGPKRGSTPGANMLPKARNFRSHRGYILVRDIGRRRKAEADGEAEQGRRPAGELRSARRGVRQAPVRRTESQTARPPASRPVRAGDPGAGTGVRSGVRARARHALPAQPRGGGVRRGPFGRHGRVLLHRPPLARGGAARPRGTAARPQAGRPAPALLPRRRRDQAPRRAVGPRGIPRLLLLPRGGYGGLVGRGGLRGGRGNRKAAVRRGRRGADPARLRLREEPRIEEGYSVRTWLRTAERVRGAEPG